MSISNFFCGLGKLTFSIKKITKIICRKSAIIYSLEHAEKNDWIILAGKGHEKYQEVKGEKFPFDDYKIAQDIFSKISLNFCDPNFFHNK